MDATFEGAARALGCGEIGFEEFLRRTEKWTGAKARWLMRRFGSVPVWLGREDLEQLVRLHLWRASQKFDSKRERATSIDRYLAFGASKAAQKQVKRAQGVNQHTRLGPSRFEILGTVACAGEAIAEIPERTPSVQDRIERQQNYEILRALCATRSQKLALRALERNGGEMIPAAEELWQDLDARLACRLVNEQHAAKLVRRTVRRLVRAYGIREGMEVAA